MIKTSKVSKKTGGVRAALNKIRVFSMSSMRRWFRYFRDFGRRLEDKA